MLIFLMNNIVNMIINSLPLHYHHQHYHYFYHQDNLNILVYLFIYFVVECQDICFNNSWYIFFEMGKKLAEEQESLQTSGGDLVSIETEEEWQFINHEIKKRSFWNTGSWHIGLE